MKLTATTVRSAQLEHGKSEAIFFDDDIPGFGLRLREGGSRRFVFQYKLGDKHRRMALGKATALNLTEIRKLALQHYASVRRGEDPAADKADAVRQVSETFESYVVKYLAALRQRLRPRSFKEIKRHLIKHAKPLHQIQLAKIARRDVAALHVVQSQTVLAPAPQT